MGVLEEFATSANISFPLLSDTGSETIHAYDLHNKDGLPHPGTIVIDQQGVVRGKIFLDGYRKRHPTSELIELAKKLGL